MTIQQRKTELATTDVLDMIAQREFGLGIRTLSPESLLARIGSLEEVEINDYCTALDKEFRGSGVQMRKLLMRLRTESKSE